MKIMELSKEQIRAIIAKRVALEFKEGDYVTLGIGLPTEVANYIPHSVHIMIQSENGLIGVGGRPEPGKVDPKITNAGGIPVTVKPGAAFFVGFILHSCIGSFCRNKVDPNDDLLSSVNHAHLTLVREEQDRIGLGEHLFSPAG